MRTLSLLLFGLLFGIIGHAQTAFIVKLKTDNPGSTNSSSVSIPTIGTGYNYDIDWENDGVIDDIGVTGNITHDYGAGNEGTYEIAISGDFPRIYFNGIGDHLKIVEIIQWGDIQWTSMEQAFSGCSNLVISSNDQPDLSLASSLNGAFQNASMLNSDLGNWDVSTISSMDNMLDNTNMSILNYDLTIAGWASQAVQAGVSLGTLGNEFCNSFTPRESLINDDSWIFTGDTKVCNCSHPDQEALEDLYIAMGGASWTNTTNNDNPWLVDCDPCGTIDGESWYGIICEFGRVTKINNMGNNLIGYIPAEIENLTELALFEIQGSISNGIPSELCQLDQLEVVSMVSSGLTGTVPPCIADLHNLRIFSLSNNNLTGSLPPFDGDNSALHFLSMYNNNFTGNIPASYGDMDLYSTFLVDGNNLSGTFDPNLGQLCQYGWPNAFINPGNNFTDFWVNFCGVAQAYVPDDNFELALQALGLDSGPLDDSVPFVNIESLISLDVSGYGIQDLTGIEHFLALEVLDASINDLTYVDLSQNIYLTCLDLSDNLLNSLSFGLPYLPAINELDLSNNNITGCWIEEFNQLLTLPMGNLNFNGNYYDGTNNFISNQGWLDFNNSDAGACDNDGFGWTNLNLGCSSVVTSLTSDAAGNIYVGGWFLQADGMTANFIAMWNPTSNSWSSLGTGMDDNVRDLMIDMDGNLIAVGDFYTAGGITVNRVAKWNVSTQTWSSMGTGADYGLRDITMDPFGNIYVSGTLQNAGGQSANRVAKWDPITETWSSLGIGVNNIAYDVQSDANGNIYIGGTMSLAGGQPTNFITKWDPISQSYSNLGIGVDSPVKAMAIAPNGDLYVGGDFQNAGGNSANYIAKWDPVTSSWSPLSGGFDYLVVDMAFDLDGNLIVVGYFDEADGMLVDHVAKWDISNQTWHSLGSGTDSRCGAVVVDPSNNIYVGGHFDEAGGIPANFIAKYSNCVDFRNLNQPVPDGSYNAATLLQSNSPMESMSDINFNAPTISLLPGFSTPASSDFEAVNTGCN